MVTCLRVCPICGEEAPSDHHIVPRAEGGTDDPKNKVWLCVSCHDIVEEEYSKTGRVFSPNLVRELQMRRSIPKDSGEENSSGRTRRVRVRDGDRGNVIIYPGETPWWLIEDREERHRANNQQLVRMWLRMHPGYSAEANRRRKMRYENRREAALELAHCQFKTELAEVRNKLKAVVRGSTIAG